MSSSRRSVQDAVRVIITRNPYLYRGLRMQVINYSATARYIQEEVETLAGDPVDPNTIVTAIMRFSKEATETATPQHRGALYGGQISLQTDIKELTFKASPREHASIVKKLVELQEQGYRLNYVLFPGSLKVITTSESITPVMQELWQYEPTMKEGYTQLNVTLAHGDERYDRIALITDLLFRFGVHMVDAFFSKDEISLILQEEDASKAFEVLRTQIR